MALLCYIAALLGVPITYVVEDQDLIHWKTLSPVEPHVLATEPTGCNAASSKVADNDIALAAVTLATQVQDPGALPDIPQNAPTYLLDHTCSAINIIPAL